MHLTLDPLDLRPEFQRRVKVDDREVVEPAINHHAAKFKHFADDAQAAIRAVGQAKYQDWDRGPGIGRAYNAVYPPKLNAAGG